METIVEQKKKRGPNFSVEDRQLLVDIVGKYAHIIENKKTDSVTVKQKEAAWKEIETNFNSAAIVKRTSMNLKWAFENFKRRARQETAEEKKNRYKAGAGICETAASAITEKVMAVANIAQPIQCSVDSDGTFHSAVVVDENEEIHMFGEPLEMYDITTPVRKSSQRRPAVKQGQSNLEKIAVCADMRAQYFKRKLEMQEIEHAAHLVTEEKRQRTEEAKQRAAEAKEQYFKKLMENL